MTAKRPAACSSKRSGDAKPLAKPRIEQPGYADYLLSADGRPDAQRGLLGLLICVLSLLFIAPLMSQLVVSLGWLLRARPGSFDEFTQAAHRFEVLDGMLAAHLAIAAFVPATLLTVKLLHQRDPAGLISTKPGMRWRTLIVSALCAVVILNLGYWLPRLDQASRFSFPSGIWLWLVIIVVTSPLQAAGEEFLFRGYLLQCLRTLGVPAWPAVVLGAAFFALMHGSQDLPLLADRFAFALFAGSVVLLTGGLEVAIAVHAVNNVFAFGYAALSGGVAQARTMQSSSWPNSGLNIVIYAATFTVCWLITRRLAHQQSGS